MLYIDQKNSIVRVILTLNFIYNLLLNSLNLAFWSEFQKFNNAENYEKCSFISIFQITYNKVKIDKLRINLLPKYDCKGHEKQV